MEEFEKLVAESFQSELIPAESAASADEIERPTQDTESPEAEASSESVSETEKAG
jgi:hypothetical protein